MGKTFTNLGSYRNLPQLPTVARRLCPPVQRLIGAGLGLAVLTLSGQSAAEEASPTGKGITGGALLGAETVMITEGIIGVESPWIYLGSAVVGAAGGGVGGYFIEQSASPRLSFYMLMGGMALLIPTAIVYIDATSTRPHDDVVFDRQPDELEDEELDAEPASPDDDVFSYRQPTRPARRTAHIPAHFTRGLLGVSPGGLALGVPDVEVSPLYTAAEVKELGVRQQTQVLIPLVHGSF